MGPARSLLSALLCCAALLCRHAAGDGGECAAESALARQAVAEAAARAQDVAALQASVAALSSRLDALESGPASTLAGGALQVWRIGQPSNAVCIEPRDHIRIRLSQPYYRGISFDVFMAEGVDWNSHGFVTYRASFVLSLLSHDGGSGTALKLVEEMGYSALDGVGSMSYWGFRYVNGADGVDEVVLQFRRGPSERALSNINPTGGWRPFTTVHVMDPGGALQVMSVETVGGGSATCSDASVGLRYSPAPNAQMVAGQLQIMPGGALQVGRGRLYVFEGDINLDKTFTHDFRVGHNAWLDIEMTITHCGGGCHSVYRRIGMFINGYAAMQVLHDTESQEVNDAGMWAVERVITGDNGHAPTSNILRVTKEAGTAPYGANYMIKIWTTTDVLELKEKGACTIDCTGCPDLTLTGCPTPHCPCACRVTDCPGYS